MRRAKSFRAAMARGMVTAPGAYDCITARAIERAGFEAVVVTLDTYLLGWRERDLQLAWLPFAHGQGIANYLADPAFRAELEQASERLV